MDAKEKTVHTYDVNVERFEKATQDFLAKHKVEEIEGFLRRVKGPLVLDAGSGPGRDSIYLRSRGLQPICIDLSREMIKRCKERGLVSCVGDIESLPIRSEAFEGIWANMSLLHISKKNMPKTLNAMREILAPQGIFYISVKEGEGERMVSSDKYPGERFFAFYQAPEIEAMLNPLFKIEENYRKTVGDMTYISYIAKKD